jgi:hypothetical protein
LKDGALSAIATTAFVPINANEQTKTMWNTKLQSHQGPSSWTQVFTSAPMSARAGARGFSAG